MPTAPATDHERIAAWIRSQPRRHPAARRRPAGDRADRKPDIPDPEHHPDADRGRPDVCSSLCLPGEQVAAAVDGSSRPT